MKNTALILFFTVLFMIPISANAQDCTDYHQYHCLYADYTFFYSRQSKSALFKQGQTSELNIVTYEGEDYYVSVCAHHKLGNVRFRILEDSESRTLIYDNASDNYTESLIFTNTVSRTLVLEVSVPESDDAKNKDRRCVGVVIQFRKSTDLDE